MNEEWKDIKGYEGLYQVSNLGNIKSLLRYVKCRGGVRAVPEIYLRKREVGGGYIQVSLSKDCKVTQLLLHRLVADAFVPNPNHLPCVNHKDENPSNNCSDNLEWCTHKYNSNYGNCKSKQSQKMKERYKDPKTLEMFKKHWATAQIPKRKKVCQLSLSNELIKIWESTYETELAGYYRSHVVSCARGIRKTHKGYKWVWYDEYIKKEGEDNSPASVIK